VITGQDPAVIRSLGVPDDVPVLPKPVTPAALRAAVERALNREPCTER
jgi:hypothetical protein